MGLTSKIEIKKPVTTHSSQVQSQEETSLTYEKHSHDHDIELDSIERLKANIFMLSDLERRLAFMNKELESILSSKKR